jgi:integrase
MGKLTEIGCKNAKCVGKKVVKLGDGDGLYLIVMASGSKYFNFRYKYDKRPKDLRIGVYPRITLSEARKLARGHRAKLDAGLDPGQERKNEARANAVVDENTFRFVGMGWYNKQVGSWSKKHAEDVLRRLEVNLFPKLGDRPINEIDGPELLSVIKIMEERGATDLSHRVNGNAGQIFRYGIACGKCKYDVAAGIVDALRPHDKGNQPAVKPKEVPQLMKAIAKYHETGDEQTQLGIKLLAHMFPRTMELIQSKIVEFDFDEKMWEVPAARMKMKYDHMVPLSRQVIGYMKRLRELAGDSEYLLPGRNILTHMSNNTLLFALYRMGYKGKMTGHGFRAVASTILNESGLFNPDWIERQLAHQEENKVRGAYNRALYIKDRRIMMQWWSDYLEALERGEKPVMHLPKPAP